MKHVYALLTVTLAALSCTVTPAPTPTPCSAFTDYDAVMTSDGSDYRVVWDLRYSDKGFHMKQTHTALNGDLLGRAEEVRVDEALYVRESLEDDPESYGEWRIAGRDLLPPEPLYCLDPQHLSENPDEPDSTYPVTQGGQTWLYEWWADSGGRPIRQRRTYEETGGVLEVTYSGWGEPNPLTAPIPTPTPPVLPGQLTLAEYAAQCQDWDVGTVPSMDDLSTDDRDALAAATDYFLAAYATLREVKPPPELHKAHSRLVEVLELGALVGAIAITVMDQIDAGEEPEDELAIRPEAALLDMFGSLRAFSQALGVLDPEAKDVMTTCASAVLGGSASP